MSLIEVNYKKNKNLLSDNSGIWKKIMLPFNNAQRFPCDGEKNFLHSVEYMEHLIAQHASNKIEVGNTQMQNISSKKIEVPKQIDLVVC